MVFAITTAQEYRIKTEDDLTKLRSEIDNSSLAINAVTSVYHLHEWLWAHVLKPKRPTQLQGSKINTMDDFVTWLDTHCPHFKLIQSLTNGSKHATPSHSGGSVDGWDQGPYGVGPYDAPYLLIDLGEQTTGGRFFVASEVIESAGTFMTDLAKKLGA